MSPASVSDPYASPSLWESGRAAWLVALAAGLDGEGLAALQLRRLQGLIREVRERSALHRARLPPPLPAGCRLHEQLAALPVCGRAEMMADFEAWLCLPAPSRAEVAALLADPGRLGAALDGGAAAWESSGTQGQPGWFIAPPQALAVYDALEAQRGGGRLASQVLLQGGRLALAVATGGHFASRVAFARQRQSLPWLGAQLTEISLMQPLPELVAELQALQPRLLATYPSAALVLAAEQAAGRLRLQLQALLTGGETLVEAERAHLQAVFGCPVRNSYGASEFLCIAADCAHGRLHLNADWVLLEPVDARLRPVPQGRWSAACLLTNLANPLQPLLRYRLDDRIRYTGEACPCGSALPVIEVQGRRDAVLQLQGADGRRLAVLPLALSTVLEEDAGVFDFELVQRGPRRLQLRVSGRGAAAEAELARGREALQAWLRAQGLAGVRIEGRSGCRLGLGRSGKLQRVRVERA